MKLVLFPDICVVLFSLYGFVEYMEVCGEALGRYHMGILQVGAQGPQTPHISPDPCLTAWGTIWRLGLHTAHSSASVSRLCSGRKAARLSSSVMPHNWLKDQLGNQKIYSSAATCLALLQLPACSLPS